MTRLLPILLESEDLSDIRYRDLALFLALGAAFLVPCGLVIGTVLWQTVLMVWEIL